MKKGFILLVFLYCSLCTSFAQIPSGYYNTATGSGYTLKTQLHNIVDGHTSVSYSALWTHYNNSDIDASDGFIWDMYSENPTGTDPYNFTYSTNQCGNFSVESDCYNREHSFPKSWFNDGTPMFSDIHHVVPTDGKVNGQRSNHPYGEVGTPTWTSQNGSKVGPSSVSGYSGTVFEPIDEYKGDFARIYFYMATRYEDVLNSWSSDMLDGSTDQVYEIWALDMLMDWHNNDPVSQKEIDRNDEIYDNIQGNRNPFVDHPEYVNSIWGSGCSGAPTTQVAGLSTTSINSNDATINWTSGDGSNRLVVLKESSAVTFSPTNTTTYSGVSADYASASDQGSGNAIVYSGIGSSINISGLNSESTYHVQVFEFCDDGPNYLLTGAPTTNFTTSANNGGSSNNVVITEIMYNSSGNDEEWIEIYNASGSNITLDANWSLSNSNQSWSYTFSGFTLNSYSYATIEVGSKGAFPFTPDIILSSSADQLVNSSSTITLTHNSSTIDEVTYDDGDDSSTDNDGPSYELISLDSDNSSTASNWSASSISGGTPGAKNSIDPTIIWDGSTSSDWDIADNWDGNAVPISTDNIIIPDVTNNPVITSNSEVNDIDIRTNAMVTISSGSLSIHGSLTLNGSMDVISGASLLPLGTTSGSGDATIARSTTFGVSDGQYSVIGSTVISGTTDDLGSIVYEYDETVAYGFNGSSRFSLLEGSASLTIADGYFSANTGDISFIGTPNSGTKAITLIYDEANDGGSSVNAGFNLVANPYPAAISYDDFSGGNVDIDGTIYLWDDGGSDLGQRTNLDYVTANSMGAASSGSGRSGDWDGYIRAGQGFFVKATTAGTLNFTADMMSTGNNTDAGFFREAKPEIVRLALSSSKLYNDIIVGFSDRATVNFDRTLDAYKIKGNSNLQLYSKMGEASLAIQALPILTEEISVPLGFDVAEAGTYTFKLPDALTYGFEVYLMDHQLDKIINLSEGDYSFETTSVSNSDRFSLVFSPSKILSLDDALENNKLIVFSNNGLLHVRVDHVLNDATVKVYDVSGTLVKEINQVDFNGQDIQTRIKGNGLYIMTVQNKDQLLIKKFNNQ